MHMCVDAQGGLRPEVSESSGAGAMGECKSFTTGLGSELKSSAKILHTLNHWAPPASPYNGTSLQLSANHPQESLEGVCKIQIPLMKGMQEKDRGLDHTEVRVFPGFGGSLVSVFNETLSQNWKIPGETIPNMSLLYPCESFNAF